MCSSGISAPKDQQFCDYCLRINTEHLGTRQNHFLKGFSHEKPFLHKSLNQLHGSSCPFCRMLLKELVEETRIEQAVGPTRDEPLQLSIAFDPWYGRLEAALEVAFPYAGGHTQPILFSLAIRDGNPSNSRSYAATSIKSIPICRDIVNTGSPQVFGLALEWIRQCLSKHDCSELTILHDTIGAKSHESSSASRLLDLAAKDLKMPDLRLVLTTNAPVTYATLSHCWGPQGLPDSARTKQGTLGTRLKYISYEILPKTFREAIDTCRALNIRYLWIDSLCIIQDSLTDWVTESSRMGQIYSRAKVCIAADVGDNPDGGCFSEFDDTKIQDRCKVEGLEICSTLSDGTESNLQLYPLETCASVFPIPAIEQSALTKRAWAFQERLLSPRVLHFTAHQLIFECRRNFHFQDNREAWTDQWAGGKRSDEEESAAFTGSTLPSLAHHLTAVADEVDSARTIEEWYLLVQNKYSGRDLTVLSDKLPAISGVARLAAQVIRCEYYAGIWKDYLGWGLSWRRIGTPRPSPMYRCPSWSWASTDSKVVWPESQQRIRQVRSSRTLVGVERIQVELDGTDPFGRVKDGHITLQTVVRDALIRPISNEEEEKYQLMTKAGAYLGQAYPDQNISHDTEILNACLIEDTVCCFTLLLAPLVGTNHKYRRIGLGKVYRHRREAISYVIDESSGITVTVV